MSYNIKCIIKDAEPIICKLNPLATSIVIKENKINCKIVDHLDINLKFDENSFLVTLGRIALGESHNHNNLYYQKEEVDTRLLTKISGHFDAILRMFILQD